MTEAADLRVVETWLDREHHARLERRVVADIEERRLMVSEADRMAGVLAPIRQQIVSLEVAQHGAVHVGAGDAGPNRVEGDPLRSAGGLEEPSNPAGWRTVDNRTLQL